MWKFVRLCVSAAVLLLAHPAHGQVAVYANFEANNQRQTSTWLTGGTFGLYDDFAKLGPLHFGADARGSILSKDSVTLSKILGGVRLAVAPPILPIKPYVQLSGGAAKPGAGTIQPGWKLAYEVNGGVDFTFLPHLDWRVVEVGGGSIQGQPGSQLHLGTGLVVRFF